ncbi:MAG: flagellin N-terminal helical domain-containing protein [Asticcacaulis sp.]
MISLSPSTGTILALQSLDALRGQALTSQAHMATGRKIASAKDNGAAYIIATHLSVQKADTDTSGTALRRGQSLVDVATAAAQSIQDILQAMKEKALSLTDTSLDTAARTALSSDLGALAKQVDVAASQGGFNGINLLNSSPQAAQSLGVPVGALTHSGTASVNISRSAGQLDLQLHVTNAQSQTISIDWGDGSTYATSSNTPGSPQSYSTMISHSYGGALQGRTAQLNISTTGTGTYGFQVPAASFTPSDSTLIPIDTSGSTLELAHHAMTASALGISGIDTMTGTQANAAVDAAISTSLSTLAYFGDRQSLLDRLVAENSKRSDALAGAVSDMTDADMAKEAATAKALQAKQALAVQALNIGNAQSGLLLQLFRQ